MSLDAPVQASPTIGCVDDLVGWMRQGERPPHAHRVGVEQEKLGLLQESGEPLPLSGPRSLSTVLETLARRSRGTLLREDGFPIGIALDGASVSSEPGGQLELSGAPATRLCDVRREIGRHLAAVRQVSRPLGIAWVAVGFRPYGRRSDVPWLPRGRYALMRRRLPGTRAHDMMQMTASVQASFDFADEADVASKVSCATAVSPVVAALFANSPIAEGRPSGFKSLRYRVWQDVDPARCGLLRFMYEGEFTYRRYVEWALAAPLLFVRRGGAYLDPDGRTLADVMREGFAGEPATLQDWTDLASTLFPEIRVKRVIEVRGSDAVDARTTLALPTLWTGLLYDAQARADARALVRGPFEALVEFQRDVARDALGARLGGTSARELAGELLRIATQGLRRRTVRGEGPDESAYLQPLREIVESGRTGADRTLEVWERSGGDLRAMLDLWRY